MFSWTKDSRYVSAGSSNECRSIPAHPILATPEHPRPHNIDRYCRLRDASSAARQRRRVCDATHLYGLADGTAHADVSRKAMGAEADAPERTQGLRLRARVRSERSFSGHLNSRSGFQGDRTGQDRRNNKRPRFCCTCSHRSSCRHFLSVRSCRRHRPYRLLRALSPATGMGFVPGRWKNGQGIYRMPCRCKCSPDFRPDGLTRRW